MTESPEIGGPYYVVHDDGCPPTTYVRLKADEPITPNIWGPKHREHPSVALLCPICAEPLGAGCLTVLLPLGPSRDPEQCEKFRSGRWCDGVAIEAHLRCAYGTECDADVFDTIPESPVETESGC